MSKLVDTVIKENLTFNKPLSVDELTRLIETNNRIEEDESERIRLSLELGLLH